MKILIICGAGMGTSVMMKIKLSQFVEEHKIDALIDSCALDEGKGLLGEYDAIICSIHLTEELGTIPEGKKLIEVSNIMDIASYGEKIKELATQ